MNQTYHIVRSFQKFAAAAALFSMLAASFPVGALTAFADSTGVTLSASSLTTDIDVQANFKVTTTYDASTTAGTYIQVTAPSGSIFDGTVDGQCNDTTPDADGKFSIDQNKGVCYSNSTAGSYTVSVQLYDASSTPIGTPATVDVTVNTPSTPARRYRPSRNAPLTMTWRRPI